MDKKVCIGTIGHIDQGKQSLAEAIMKMVDLSFEKNKDEFEILIRNHSFDCQPISFNDIKGRRKGQRRNEQRYYGGKGRR